MIKIKNNSSRDFLILNLTDPQLKAEEWNSDNKTGKIFKKTVETLIQRVSPDLITLSGDLSYAGAFDLICRLGSTKNIICGHNHINNWVVDYEGVRFIFGTKTGNGSYWEPEINGGTVIAVNENGVSSVKHEYVDVSEILENK